MKKTMMMLAACAAAIVMTTATGCSVKKIEYEKNDKGEMSYRIYENDHWLKTESTGIKGGMTADGRFEFEAEGMKSSPSEEFNRTMQTYTTAFVQLAQIAAAAYNPSASQAVSSAAKSASTSTTPTVVVNTQQAEASAAGGTSGSATGERESGAAASRLPTTNQPTTNPADCPDCVDPPTSSDAARTSANQ